MKFKLLLLSLSFLVTFFTAQSQEYLKMMDAGTYKVETVISTAEAYFAGKDKGRGSGYKQFKRWEYNALRLMNEDGYLPIVSERIAELQQYNAYLNETAQNRQVLSDNWQELGPTSWNSTTGWNPGVGRVTGIAVDKTNNDHIIIGANTGGVWKTTDGGQNWIPLNDNFTNLSVYSVAINPADSNTYYFGSTSGVIFKSTDSGATWNQFADISNSLINKVLIHPTNSNIMFACSQNAGIYRTVDGGNTWQSIGSDSKAYDVEFKPGDPSVVYASGIRFQKSVDGGETFTIVSGFDFQPKMIGVSPDNPSIVYVVEANNGIFGGFYNSSDSGSNFTKLNHGGSNFFGYSTSGNDNSGQAPRDMDIAVNPNDVNEVHIAGVLTWRSTNAGVTFNCTSDWIPGQAAAANRGYCHADVDILEFVGSTLFVGTDGGIYKAENTTNVTSNYYTDLTSGIGIRQFYKIGVSQTQDVVVTGGSQDNGSSFYTAANGWYDWLGADGMEGFIDKDNPLTMYGTSQYGNMYRTLNGGNSYNNINSPGSGSGNWVSPFEQDPSVSNTIYIGYDIVYKSINRGNSWTPISQNFGSYLEDLKIAPSNNQIMYVVDNGFLFKTIDGGSSNWSQVASPGGLINNIAIHPTNPDMIAAATTNGNKIMVSVDGGNTWTSYKKNLPNFSALSVVWDDNGEDGLYLGMDYGIYYIDNTLEDWQPYSNNLPNVIVNELDINTETNMLYAATYGRGLWVSPVVDPLLAVADIISEKSVTIHPNPATNSVIISLEEPLEGDIRVFDTSGKLVIYQADRSFSRSNELNISDLQNGVYFIRINSEKGIITKKLIKN